MAAPSSPALPSSFDPALHLHSEGNSISNPPPLSESHSSELEAFNLQRLETIREKTRNGVVIQHRAWNLSEIFRSDEDIQPETPTKRRPLIASENLDIGPSSDTIVPSSPPPKMPLISSPVLYPPSSPTPKKSDQKRKSEGPSSLTEPKRPRMIGGFLDDDDEDDDIQNLQDAQLPRSVPLENSMSNSQLSNMSTFDLGILNERPSQSENLGSNIEWDTPVPVTLSQSTNRQSRENGTISMKTCSGRVVNVKRRTIAPPVPYEKLVADRSTTAPGKATRSYYGINIHQLMDEAAKEEEQDKIRRAKETAPEPIIHSREVKRKANPMWAEKYRAKKFTDLIGDDRTHRSVLRWLKGWDRIVFPGLAKAKKKTSENDTEERVHRKILLLPGPPGLGKTTLAHVCAKQAGYEVLEINASDERSRDVVKGRIKDAVGTENVRGINVGTGDAAVRKAGKPVCVIVDEVDGVTTGSSGAGGEGGFMKALIDLIMLDQRNSNKSSDHAFSRGRKSKGDKFRMLRPLILICNDVYHPSLRPLRASSLAEIVQIRQPPLEKVIQRMKGVFEKEGIPCDLDGARRLCEASWGITAGRDNRNRAAGEGDIRSVLVAGEWVAHKFRSSFLSSSNVRLSKMWIEQHVLNDSLQGSSSRGLGRGGTRAIVDRVFLDGAGLPNTLSGSNTRQTAGSGQTTGAMGVAEFRKTRASNWLREMVDTSGEYDRCITDCFARYPTQAFRDDTTLSKPNAAYEWLHFHDQISSKVFSNQEWELNPYLSQSVVAFHHLFASSNPQGWDTDQNKTGDDEDEEEHPFSGPRADFAAFEAEKENRSILVGFQSSFSAHLTRLFNSHETVATDLIPNLIRMLSPDINPIIVGGSGQKGVASVRKESERNLVNSAVTVMSGIGVTFEKARVEIEAGTHGGWVYRMEPPLDTLTTFSKTQGSTISSSGSSVPVRYAVRQVLDQEYRKEIIRRQSEAQKARYSGVDSSVPSAPSTQDAKAEVAAKASSGKAVKRDFFGRVIKEDVSSSNNNNNNKVKTGPQKAERPKVWVKYHEGYSNAVRKPISMKDLLAGL
ncbi:hypothetical protein FQN54_004228 [Arachnomyces sp. PD_36]|nr:hypothetical protein FQN54_004228 [Arachnomyces sp. PD_36]